MYRYEVGQLYAPHRTQWPEQVEYNFRDGAHELRLFFPQPTPTEIAAVGHEKGRFALTVLGDVIFFCFRFGHMPWSDCVYSWHLLPAEQRQQPAMPTGDERILLAVMLINAGTGRIAALRTLSLAPDFSRALVQAIQDQIAKPFDVARYDRQLVFWQQQSTDTIVAKAIARCNAGD